MTAFLNEEEEYNNFPNYLIAKRPSGDEFIDTFTDYISNNYTDKELALYYLIY